MQRSIKNDNFILSDKKVYERKSEPAMRRGCAGSPGASGQPQHAVHHWCHDTAPPVH